jgi:eukaryotic-like serine/threonine-protein kinase
MNYGRYQIVAELGRGSMGVVYKAHDPQIDRPIALKVLREDRVTSDDFVRRFLKEAMAVGRLSHPGIVTVYDIGQDHGTIYIAMEFLKGKPLDELMATRKFTLQEIVDIGIQTAQALHYAHKNGIVHRDIKPPNIIYSSEGTIRVTDFGIAHIEDPSGHQMTQAGEILGTPLYMSPEQVAGQPLDGRSDIYSLGVILYQLTTGRRPFQGPTLAAVFRAITQDTPEQPHLSDPAIPEPLSRLIMKLLDKDPAKRFADGHDLIEALQKCLNHPPSVAPQKDPHRIAQKRQSPGIGKILIYGLACLILGIVLGVSLWYQHKTSPPPAATPVLQTKEDTPALKPDLPDSGLKIESTRNSITNRSLDKVEKTSPSDMLTLLKMESRPPGADLYIDGSHIGTTPVTLKVAAGKHEVKLRLDKHLGWEAQVDLSKGGEVPLSIQLLPEHPAMP